MPEQLAGLLDQQITQLEALITLQASEKELLIKRDAPALDVLTQDKEKLLDHIQTLDNQVADHPQREIISTHPALRDKRKTIIDLMNRCQSNNDVNGQLVRMTLGRIQQLKQTLQAAQSGTTITYTNKGKTSSGPSGSSIKA
ncbi:MAG: flagellar protein FlgN [Idiomarina sp.]|nr:flagellar protein FlgN [Idiomarina sp.]